MRKSICLLPTVLFAFAFGLALFAVQTRVADAQEEGVIPASYQSGSFFSRELGTALRFNYHTQGYGTQEGVFSLGGMKVFNMEGATFFLDGQGTLSDDFGGGFNLGAGYRQLTTLGNSFDNERIMGASLWTDGQSSVNDNFFTQLGFSLESLGDKYDVRLNGHFPLEREKEGDATLISAGEEFYSGNNLFGALEEFGVDTALDVLDGEVAVRVADMEAWAFAGAYYLGGGTDDTGGYRLGMRGYAVPDVAVSFAVTDDDIYDTNFLFGITWFIGRTHKGNAPCGTLLDRFREPVQRNDFIAMTNRRDTRVSGDALTVQGSTDLVSIVHVDSSAAAGGDGTFENPFDEISDADINIVGNDGNSAPNDIIYVHSDSAFTGTSGQIVLQENQRLLGEGIDQDGNTITHNVLTNLGSIPLPETAVGAQALARATIDATGTAGSVIELADGSAIDNFTISNAIGTAISANGVTVPTGDTISNVLIEDSATGISMTDVIGAATINSNVQINGSTTAALVVDGGEDAFTMNGAINDTIGNSLIVRNRTDGTVSFAGTIDDDANVALNTSQGILIGDVDPTMGNTGGNVSFDGASLVDIHVDAATDIGFHVLNNTDTSVGVSGAMDITATGDAQGVRFEGNDVDSSMTFSDLNASAIDGNTVSVLGPGSVTLSSSTTTDPDRGLLNTGAGSTFFNDGAAGSATIVVNSNIINRNGGEAVRIVNRAEDNNVTFNGTVESDGAAGVFADNNSMGTVAFNGALTLNSAAANGVELTNNTADATFNFGDLAIETSDGNAFVATDGGNLLVTSASGTNDILVTGSGIGLQLNGMTIDPGDVTFDTVNVNGSTTFGVDLQNLDGTGTVNIGGGTNAGDGGTITAAGTGININNADNVLVNNVTVSGIGDAVGVSVSGQQAGSTAIFNGMDVTIAGAGDAVNVSGNDEGIVTFGDLTATTSNAGPSSGDAIEINNADGSLVAVNVTDATVNANGTGRGFFATGGGTLSVTGTNEINSTTGAAFAVINAESLTATDVTINNTAARGVVITGQDNATDNVALTNFNVNTEAADGVTIDTNSDGTITATNLSATSTTGRAVLVDNNTGGTVNLSTMTAESTDGNTVSLTNNGGATLNITSMNVEATGTGDAFTATGGGTLSTTGTNNVTSDTGHGVNIDGMTIAAGGAGIANVDVAGSTDFGINLSNVTGGPVTVGGGTITAATNGVTVTNVESAAINDVTIDNTGGNGLVVNNAVGETLSVSNLDVTTTTGEGVNVTGGTFSATGTNSIATTTGTGLTMTGAEIGAAGANFATVDVNGAINAVVLDNLSGGQVTVGSAATASTITTTGDAITITNTANVDVNNVDITTGAAGLGVNVENNNANDMNVSLDDVTVGDTGASALIVNHTGAGDFTMAVNNSDFDDIVNYDMNGSGVVTLTFNDNLVDTSGTDVAFRLLVDDNVTDANIVMLRSQLSAEDATALDFDSNSVAVKDVTFQFTGGSATNNSASVSAEIDAFGPTAMNTTVTNSTFRNNGVGDNLDIAANDSTSIVNLLFTGNITNGGTDTVIFRELDTAAVFSDFNIVGRGTPTLADDPGLTTDNPGVGNFSFDSVGNVFTDFDDIPALP